MLILGQRYDEFAGQAVFLAVRLKLSSGIARETSTKGADPQRLLLVVLQQRMNVVVPQSFFRAALIEDCEPCAVEAGQPLLRAHP